MTAQLFNVGAADRPDYLEIEIESRRLQLQLNRSRNERFALRAQLAALTGVSDVADRPLAGSIDVAIPNLEREQIVRTLLQQSPELRAARADLERARAVTARARRQTFPDLFLRGGSDYKVRLSAAIGLGNQKDSRAITPLVTALEKDGDKNVRAAAAASLGKIINAKTSIQPANVTGASALTTGR